jgi:hypothetical protein
MNSEYKYRICESSKIYKENKEKRGYYLKKYLNKELSYGFIYLFTSI